MEDVVEQGVGDVADDLLSATLHHWGFGLNHGYGEDEEGFAELGENHFLAGGEVVKPAIHWAAQGAFKARYG